MVFVKIHPHKLVKSMQKGVSIPIHHAEQYDPELPIFKLHFKNSKKSGSVARNLANAKNIRVKLHELEDITDHHGGSIFSGLKNAAKSVIKNKQVQNIAKNVLNQGASKAIDLAGSKFGLSPQITGIAKDLSSNLINQGVDRGASIVAGSGIRNRKGKGLIGSIGQVMGNMLDSKIGFGIDQTGLALGGTNPVNSYNNNKDKMAYARAHRKKKAGGSMVPLGTF